MNDPFPHNDNGYKASIADLDYRTKDASPVRRRHAKIVGDGEVVRVSLAMMDSTQQAVAATTPARVFDTTALDSAAVASNAASGQATVDRMRAAQPQVQAAVDRAIKGAAQRDHDLTRNGYHLSLDYGPRNA